MNLFALRSLEAFLLHLVRARQAKAALSHRDLRGFGERCGELESVEEFVAGNAGVGLDELPLVAPAADAFGFRQRLLFVFGVVEWVVVVDGGDGLGFHSLLFVENVGPIPTVHVCHAPFLLVLLEGVARCSQSVHILVILLVRS